MCVQVSFCFYLVIDLSFSCIKIFAALLKNRTQFPEGFRWWQKAVTKAFVLANHNWRKNFHEPIFRVQPAGENVVRPIIIIINISIIIIIIIHGKLV